jgi:hypothetical protein
VRHVSAEPVGQCVHCGNFHPGVVCPRVKAIEYFENGTVKRVEYHEPREPQMVPFVVPPACPAPPAPWLPGHDIISGPWPDISGTVSVQCGDATQTWNGGHS